jgi:hypothetical protein
MWLSIRQGFPAKIGKLLIASSANHRTLADFVDLGTWPLPPGRRTRQSRFDAATEIQTLLREDAAKSNQVHNQQIGIGIYRPVRRVDPDACRHDCTICRACRRQWEQDYFLAIFTHATTNAYRNQGCRCTPCRLVANRPHPAARYPDPPALNASRPASPPASDRR